MKNKTLATWLTLVGGPLGLHRFYLRGGGDLMGWLLPVPSLLGVYGILRARAFGVDDRWSWLLSPLLGFVVAGCALTAIVYGLRSTEGWNRQFNPDSAPDGPSGRTGWLTVGAVVLSLMVGAGSLMAALAVSFQHYFESDAGPAVTMGARPVAASQQFSPLAAADPCLRTTAG